MSEKNMDVMDEIEKEIRRKKVEIRAEDKLYQEFYTDKIYDNPDMIRYMCGRNKQLGDEFVDYLLKRGNRRYRFALITPDFKDNMDVKEVCKKIEKCCKKKWIGKFLWCVEWRQEDSGLHAHIRIEITKKKKPSEMKREVFNTFKNLVTNTKFINWRFSNRDNAFVDYVMGYKVNKKSKKMELKKYSEVDKKMREKYKLKNYYMGENKVGEVDAVGNTI